jgi:hypothetical protein
MGLLADHFTKPKGDNPVARGYHNLPDANGHFGRYGGRFVAETLMPCCWSWNPPI